MYFDASLWQFTRGFRGWISLAVAFGLVTAASGVARLAISGYAIALVLTGASSNRIIVALILVGIAIFGRSVFQYLKEITGHRAAIQIQYLIRSKLYVKLLSLGPGVLDQKRTGDVSISMVDGVESLETYFGEYLPQLFVAIVTPVGLFTFMWFFDPQLAAIYLLFSLFTLFVPAAFHRMNATSSTRRRRAYGNLGAEFLDSIQGLATLKSFGQSRARGDHLAEKAHEVTRTNMSVMAANMATTGITWFGISIGAAAALGYGGLRVADGSLELAALLIVVMMGVEAFRPLRELTNIYHRGMFALASTRAVFDILDEQPNIIDTQSSQQDADTFVPTVEFQDVEFEYPTREELSLNGVSLKVESGERIGVVGASGAGKSTLVWLALRFFDVKDGAVKIGGMDVREIPLETLRQRIAVVTQDTYLFHGTVAENIRFGKSDASLEEVERAARIANIHDFIMSLPAGYDTLIGERGIRLSGGQRQRVAIARAALKDAPILILDEALSSVDAENESIIQESLERVMEGRTTLIIAHRLSSVIGCDRVIVLENGRLVEQGTHQELLRNQGPYLRLMTSQLEEATAPPIESSRLADAERIARRADQRFAESQRPALQRDIPMPPDPQESLLTANISRMGFFSVAARLWGLIWPWKFHLTVTFVLGVLRVGVLVAIGVVSALLVRQVHLGGDITPHLWWLAALAVCTPLFHWGETWIAHDMAFRLLAEMRIAMYRKLDALAPAYLVRKRSGDIVSAVTTDVETVENFFAHTVAPAFVAFALPIAVLVVTALIEWKMALTLLPFLLLIAYSPFRARTQIDELGLEARQRLGDVNAHMVDSIQGIREILAFGQEKNRAVEMMRHQELFGELRQRYFHEVTLHRVLIEAVIGFGSLAVLAVGTYSVNNGSLTADLLPLLTIVAMASFIPVTEIAQVAQQLADTFGSARRVFAVYDEPVTIQDGGGVDPEIVAANRTASFSDVAFSYGPNLNNALDDASFTLDRSQILALVGPSGAGKTTSAHLLLRFWDPASGKVEMASNDLRDFTTDDLRNNIALVAQDTYLFNTSIMDNLRIANPSATDEQVIEASKQAAAHEFISEFPEGYETQVGERGFQLSGGQRQRVSIARAFLKNAPILILDEATSQLDAESERLIHDSLKELMAGRTTLIIAHRLSTVRDADKIVVLDEGRVVEQGTHEELITREGLYSALVATQVATQPSGSE